MANPSSLRSRTQQRQPAVEQSWEEEDASDGQGNDDFDVALHLASHAQRLKNVDNALGHFNKSLKNFQAIYAHERNRQNTLMGIMAGCLVLAVALLIFWPRPNSNTNNNSNVVQQRSVPAAVPAYTQAAQQPVQMPQPLQTYSQPVITQPIITQAPLTNNPVQNNLGQNNYAPAPQAIRPVVALGARYDQQQQRSTQSYLSAPAAQTIYAAPAPVQPRLTPFQLQVQNKLAARGEVLPSEWQTFFDREARGDKKGKLLIAAKFLKGDGVTRDQAFAVEMIRQAADAGEKEAMMWLAFANQGGSLGKTDITAAIRWFQAAGKAGVNQAYTELGRIYEMGADGAPDIETALAWYQRGAQSGDSKAAEAIARLTAQQQQLAPQQMMQPSYAPQPAQSPGQSPAQQVQQLLQPVTQNNAPINVPSAAPINTAQNDIFVPAPPVPNAAQQASTQNIPVDTAIDNVSPAYPASGSTVAATPVVASVPTPAPSTQVGMSKEQASADNKAIQRMLRVLGYKVDRVDGEYGPQTASAIRAYQRDRSAYPDGEPSAELIDALMRDVRGQ